MWDRFILQPGLSFWVGDKAPHQELKEVEQALRVTLPRSLRSFLAEMDGCSINLAGLELPDSDRQKVNVVWSCREVIARNVALREGEAQAGNGYMAHKDMLWFVSQPNGDLAGFRATIDGVPDSTIFLYSPGHPSEPRPQAASLREYLTERLRLYRQEYGRDLWEMI
jgi:hypothetical protein